MHIANADVATVTRIERKRACETRAQGDSDPVFRTREMATLRRDREHDNRRTPWLPRSAPTTRTNNLRQRCLDQRRNPNTVTLHNADDAAAGNHKIDRTSRLLACVVGTGSL